jgi:hypothetical protein
VSPVEPTHALLRGRPAPQLRCVTGESGELFAGKPVPRTQARSRRLAPELTAARVLCRQLARKRARLEKQRIVHLICLNLRAMLNRPSPGA